MHRRRSSRICGAQIPGRDPSHGHRTVRERLGAFGADGPVCGPQVTNAVEGHAGSSAGWTLNAAASFDHSDDDSCASGTGERRFAAGAKEASDEAVPRLDTIDAHDLGCHVGGSDGHRADTTCGLGHHNSSDGLTPIVLFPAWHFTRLEVTVHNQHVDPNCPSSGTFEDLVFFDPGPTFSQVCRDEMLTLRYDADSHKPMPRRFSEQRGVKVSDRRLRPDFQRPGVRADVSGARGSRLHT